MKNVNGVNLTEANLDDAMLVHQMQIESFKNLLARYQDFELNPGAESIEKILARLTQVNSKYFLIQNNNTVVGAIRIFQDILEGFCRVSPVFILPEYRNKGITQEVFRMVEGIYRPKNGWRLDTILEEPGNCHLYEKMGYRMTGKIDYIKEGMHIVHYEKIV